MIGLAVLDRPVAVYRMVDLRRSGGSFDPAVLQSPRVAEQFQHFGYRPADFDLATARTRSFARFRDLAREQTNRGAVGTGARGAGRPTPRNRIRTA